MAYSMSREEIIKEAKNMDQTELIEKLMKDSTDYVNQLPKHQIPKEDLWSLNEWDTEMQKHPLFMTKPPAAGEELPPLIEAIQSLKYDPDENTPEELAQSYKEDGNENFKRKKYRWAVDSYTQGLNAKCSDYELNAQLYTNRAAAHYHIGNYEKSLRDAAAAKALKPDHIKCLERGALCCFKLNKWCECINWCDGGLKIFPENKLLDELKCKAAQKKKSEDRDRRKALAIDSKRQKELEAIKKAIGDRKIQLGSDNLSFDKAQALCPNAVISRVYLDQNNKLVWPVMILYPEYGTSDYIKEFHEDTVFLDHFKEMFLNEPPGWDQERKYTPENLQLVLWSRRSSKMLRCNSHPCYANEIYFMDNTPMLDVIPVKSSDSLKKTLSHKKYRVYDGTPAFFVTVAGSTFDKSFRQKYNVIG